MSLYSRSAVVLIKMPMANATDFPHPTSLHSREMPRLILGFRHLILARSNINYTNHNIAFITWDENTG